MELALGIALLVMAAATKADVLYTYGINAERMVSGAITGGSDSSFGRTKTSRRDKVLGTLTFVFAILFAVTVIAAYCIV